MRKTLAYGCAFRYSLSMPHRQRRETSVYRTTDPAIRDADRYHAAADVLDDARNRYAARRRPELRRLLAERPLTACVDAGTWHRESGGVPIASDCAAWIIETIDDRERALAEAMFSTDRRAQYVERYVAARAAAEADGMTASDLDLEVA